MPTPNTGHRRRIIGPWIAAAVVAISIGALILPIPRITPFDDEIADLLHAPCFAVLAAICCSGWRRLLPGSPWAAGAIVWMLVSLIGLASEWLQSLTARTPGWQDAIANVVGAAAGVLWFQGRFADRRALHYGSFAVAAALIITISVKPALTLEERIRQWRAVPALASFERPRELRHWTINDGRATRTQRHATKGEWSMRLDLFPSRWPGASLRPARDWSQYDELVFDVRLAAVESDTTETETPFVLIVKVADADHNHQTEDRFHESVRLTAGEWRTVRIRLSDVRTAPVTRLMDLSQIVQLQFFTIRPVTTRTIWLDNIRLE